MTTNTNPQTIHDLYTFYLSPAHVGDKPRTVTIDSAVIREVYSAQLNRNISALVVHFKDARRSLKLNRTQTEDLWELTGTDDHTKWSGTRVTLSTAKTKGGKITIVISKPEE